MNYPWLDDYLCAKKGVVKEYKLEWESFRFLLEGKMIALQGNDNNGKSIISFKLEPADSEILRNKYTDITPGYYLNKTHWSSVDLNGGVPDDVVRHMADESYRLILASLPKKLAQQYAD